MEPARLDVKSASTARQGRQMSIGGHGTARLSFSGSPERQGSGSPRFVRTKPSPFTYTTSLHKKIDPHSYVVLQSGKKENHFGVEKYTIPKSYHTQMAGKNMMTAKSKRSDFITEIQAAKKFVPPAHYKTGIDWGTNKHSAQSKAQRITVAGEIMGAKFKTPGANHYEMRYASVQERVPGKYKWNEDRDTFIDAAVFQSKQSPGSQYEPNMKLVKPRSFNTTYYPVKKERFQKLKKNDPVGPGVYDNDKTSIMYKMTKKQTGWTIGKDKRINFAEREAKRKGFVPGSGQYQDVNQTKIYKKMNQTFSF